MPIDSVRWGRGRKERFTDWIDSEVTEALGTHTNLVRQWIKWLELYRAPVKQPVRNLPYEGAANFMLPVIATDADQLYAKHIQTIHAAENLWTLKPLNENWVDAAKPLQDFLTWLDHSALKMYDVNKRVVGEMVKLGTGIYKTGWHYERRRISTYDDSGKVIKADRIKGMPFVDHVRLADFIFPASSYAIQPDVQGGAPWVGERLRIGVDRLKWLATSSDPMLPNVDKEALTAVLRFEESGVTEWDAAIQRQDYDKAVTSSGLDFEEGGPRKVSGAIPSPTKMLREVELWEIHARFPTTDSDSEDDVIVWWHPPTRRVVRAVYNYLNHGARPYDVIRMFPGDGFYGIGTCEQLEMFQLAESDLFNFNWDNVLLANSRMVVAKSGQNIAPGESFYPNKVWIVDDDVNKAFGVFPMADIYQSLPLLQQQLATRGEKRSGIGDLQRGQMDSLPGRTPATTTLSLMQEGNRRPDLTVKDMRYSGLSTVGLRVLQNCQQFMGSPIDVGGQTLLAIAMEMLGTPEGALVGQKLMTPLENAEFGVGVQITATSGTQNKEVERQDYMSLMQVAGQVGQQVLQLTQIAQQMAGTPVGAVAIQAAKTQQELMTRVYERFDIRNSEEILPLPPQTAAQLDEQQQVGELLTALLGPGGGIPVGADPGSGGPDGGPPVDSGMEGLPGGAEPPL